MCAFEIEFRNMFDDAFGLRFETHQNHGIKRVYSGDTPSVETIREKCVNYLTGRERLSGSAASIGALDPIE